MADTGILVIDHGSGNLKSVCGALDRIGVPHKISSNTAEILNSRKLLLPGVGSFKSVAQHLRETQISNAVTEVALTGGRILGICLGMQLMCEWSEEDGGSPGLGLLPGAFQPFGSKENPVQGKTLHMGFNSVHVVAGHALFRGIPNGSDFYFAHSFRMSSTSRTNISHTALTHYQVDFVSAVGFENRIFGVQFHPELSQGNGLQLLRNYADMEP